MSEVRHRVFEFGPFRLDATQRLLFERAKPIAMTPKALQILLLLVERAGRVVDKAELFRAVWPDTIVEDATLAQNVFTLRKHLHDGQHNAVYIETIPKRGYRFVAPVTVHGALHLEQGSVRTTVRQPPDNRLMLVVLPIANKSGDAELDYLSDGFTEAIINELGTLNPDQLAVIARTSAMAYKETGKTIREVATELGVHYVVEGSLHHYRRRVVVSAQLVRVADQTPLWSRSYERPLLDLLRVQSEVGAAVVNEVRLSLTLQRRPAVSPETVDPALYELYLKGRYSWNRRTAPAIADAIRYFESAIALDPQFAPAYGGLAICWTFRTLYGSQPPRDTYPAGKAAALRAIELDPGQAEARAALGLILSWFEYDCGNGEVELQRAIEIDPSSAMTRQYYAAFLTMLGRHQEALQQVRLALRVDPLSPSIHMVHGLVLEKSGYYHSAIEAQERALSLYPDYHVNRAMLALNLCRVGRTPEGIEHLLLACRNSGNQPDLLAQLGGAYAFVGMEQQARDVLDQIERVGCYASPYYLARIHANLHDLDAAIACLERAFEERSLPSNTPRDDLLRPLFKDPRFQQLVARMNLPPVPRADH